MRIKQSACQQNFKGIYNNKAILKGLELASDYSASFVATSSFLGAVALRPLAISLTPNVDKENKKVISAESIASAISKLVVAEAMILPVENAIKKINQDPTEYLSEDTIKNLANNSKELVNSKSYNFLAQIIKFSSNIFASIPKTVLSVALIPILADFLFSSKEEKNKNKDLSENYLIKRTIDNNQNFVNFKGKNKISNAIATIIENKDVQEFAKKHSKNDINIAKNMTILNDVILTTGSIIGVKKSKKIDEDKKNPLILNKFISSAISIFSGHQIDKFIQNNTKNVVEKLCEIQKNNPKLQKYISGLNVARPTIIFALIYYGIIPVISTFISEKMSAKNEQTT